jgi:hypothetical protein
MTPFESIMKSLERPFQSLRLIKRYEINSFFDKLQELFLKLYKNQPFSQMQFCLMIKEVFSRLHSAGCVPGQKVSHTMNKKQKRLNKDVRDYLKCG